MREGALSAALIASALALALAVAPGRGRWRFAVLFAVTTAGAAIVPWPAPWRDAVFAANWVAVAVAAVTVHTPSRLGRAALIGLAIYAGVCAGAVIAIAGSRLDLIRSLPCVLLSGPAAWLTRRSGPIPARVAASWLIAIAVLCAALPHLRVTPGYLPDHLD